MTDHCIPSRDTAEHHCPFSSNLVLRPRPAPLHLTSLFRAPHGTFLQKQLYKPFPWLQSCFLLLCATAHSHTHPAVHHPPSRASLGPSACWVSVEKSSMQSCTELSGQRGPLLQAGLAKRKESSSLPFGDKASIHYQLTTAESPSVLLTDLY